MCKTVKQTKDRALLRLRPVIRGRIAATLREKDKERFYRQVRLVIINRSSSGY